MQYDIPKSPPKTQYVLQKPFHTISREDCAVNDYAGKPAPEAGDWGGFMFSSTASTSVVASGTSLSTVRSYEIHFVPTDGVVPSYVMQQQQVRRNLECIYFPKKKSV